MTAPRRSPRPVVLALALVAAAPFAAVARAAHATEPVSVRAVLHPRRTAGDAGVGSVYVDITVEGTSAPIRLVRHVAGTCTVVPDGHPEGVFLRVECTTAAAAPVLFEVARDGAELVVRRTMPPSDSDSEAPAAPPAADASVAAPLVVIARSVLPPRAVVRVRP